MAHNDDHTTPHLAADLEPAAAAKAAGRQTPIPEELLQLLLKCCCCGRVLESLLTPWRVEDVMSTSIWTKSPCSPCETRLRTDPTYRTQFEAQ